MSEVAGVVAAASTAPATRSSRLREWRPLIVQIVVLLAILGGFAIWLTVAPLTGTERNTLNPGTLLELTGQACHSSNQQWHNNSATPRPYCVDVPQQKARVESAWREMRHCGSVRNATEQCSLCPTPWIDDFCSEKQAPR